MTIVLENVYRDPTSNLGRISISHTAAILVIGMHSIIHSPRPN